VAAGSASKLGQPLGVGQRRRTNNSDEIDIETEAVDSVVELEKVLNESEGVAEQPKERLGFFSPLIRAAASMNPQQFELPLELIEPITFPGMFALRCPYISL